MPRPFITCSRLDYTRMAKLSETFDLLRSQISQLLFSSIGATGDYTERQRPSMDAMEASLGRSPAVVCNASPPYHVCYANTAWERLCGFSTADMMGRSLGCLQGPATDKELVARLMESVRAQQPCVIPSMVNCERAVAP